MPDEQMWDQFFDPVLILKGMGIPNLTRTIVDMGCGMEHLRFPRHNLIQERFMLWILKTE
jgi:hypothetical protein